MICCLNPNCPQPNHTTLAEVCPSCGSPLTPRLRGRYCPIKLIGRGGFGRTYLAVDSDRLNNRCVIKQFAPQTQGTKSFLKAVQLFEQEAMRLNDLGEHPQIPTLLAYFEQDQYLYLVQQMIAGHTLFQELTTQGPFSETTLRLLLDALLPVLDFIHSRGVIHRDITPTNIIRRKTDHLPVLIDFGVARQFSETVLYEPGTRIGTDGYAPIEQLRSGQAYPSSDLYSLGATCLHLLTGCKPEELYNPLEGRWMWQDRLQQMGRSLSPGLAEVLNCMTRDLVSERYQSAQDLMHDLKRLPKLAGSVPGWASAPAPDSLFSNLPQRSMGGPGETAGLSLPTTALPQPPATSPVPGPAGSQLPPASGPVSSPPVSQPQPSQPPAVPPSRPPVTHRAPAAGPAWRAVKTLTTHQSWVMTVAFHPQQPLLVSGGLDDTIQVWNWETDQVVHTLSAHDRGVNGIALGTGGQVLVSCGDDAAVKVWNLSHGTLLHTLKGHLRDVTAVAIGAQGLWVASSSKDGTIKLWSLTSGKLVNTLSSSAGMTKTVAFTHHDDRLISGGLDNKVRLWDPHTGTCLKVLAAHTNTVNQVAVSPDDRLIASASKDRTVRLWNGETGELVQTLVGHSQDVNGVAFFPDSQRVLSGSSDGSLRIWHVDGTLQHRLTAHINPVHGLAVHTSGQLLASASADKTVKLWQWVP
ncbi:MAG TPA: protein kinase [Leptolyngbyaceae cyanobacterium M65_K2018_010]|nr:protein kinase [Leptolyngbyaceae cyanobacterium M65_K2018_010]